MNLTNIIKNAIDEALSNTHTSTIAKIVKVNKSTIDLKPVFKRVVNNVEIDLPIFPKVPILTLQGGSNYRIMPINAGDTALLVFSERCLDDWFFGSDDSKPRELRMHDYSDAIAIVGLNNINKAITIPKNFEKVFGDINHDGNLTQKGNYTLTGNVSQTGNYSQKGDYNQTGDYTIKGNIKVTGNVICSGAVSAANFTGVGGGSLKSNVTIETTKEVVANGKKLSTHTHNVPEHQGVSSTPN